MMNRRHFLTTTAAAAGAISLPAASYARIIGANARLNVGVVGIRGRGRDHVQGFGEHVIAVCDCDQSVLDGQFSDKDFRRYRDYRELVSDNDIDIVSIATPNHTHAIISIAAIRAGKDVYVEKPVSHNVWEGRQIVEAARQHRRLVQCGTQSRSSSSLQAAHRWIGEGHLGNVQYAIGTCYKPRMSIGKLSEPLAIPDHLDYDLWCGPAEKVDLYRPQLHYDWHWDFNTGNGDMGNQGIHQMDIARWFLGQSGLSKRILSVGGRLGYDDAGDTPNTQTVLHEFDDCFLIFETRGLPASSQFHSSQEWPRNMDSYRGAGIGVIVQCEGGHLLIPSYTSAVAYDQEGREINKWDGAGNHYQNLIQAIEADDRNLLAGEILEGHLSSALCHTGSISHLLGTAVDPGEIESAVSFNSVFADSYQRMAEHLIANGVDIHGSAPLTLGADLAMDPATEQFHDHPAADQRLRREYRKPFEIVAN